MVATFKKNLAAHRGNKKAAPRKTRQTAKVSLKKDITPGSVLILLAGRHRGKRVTFLKMLDSGLLLVTGPYKTNGVPLKRVNQRYCIGTSTKVGDLSKLDLAKFSDDYFKREKSYRKEKGEEAFFAEPTARELPAAKQADQKKIDSQIKLDGALKKYLKARSR